MDHVGIIIQDSEGTMVGSSLVNFAPILSIFFESKNKSAYPLLSSINPYEDTFLVEQN